MRYLGEHRYEELIDSLKKLNQFLTFQLGDETDVFIDFLFD